LPGVFLTIIAVLLRIVSNPVANVFQKTLTARGHHPLVVNFLTYLGLSVLCLPIALRVPWSALPADFWIFSVLGGIAGAAGNGFLVKALQKGDLSVLGPINAYKSVVGIMVGIFLLGEIPNSWGIAGTFLIIGGSYFVLDTAEGRFSWALLRRQDIQYRLWALVLTAIEAVFIKRVILASGVYTAFVSWCWGGALFAFLLLPLYRLSISTEWGTLPKVDFGPYMYLVLCIGLMQLTTNYVFDHMPVGYALALFQLSTLVSVLLGQRVFKETDIRKKLIGSLIMIGGSLLIILLNGK
jgi:drug/metabolite transporter (DMT)-like permease